jgi:hypothetical protein
MTDAKKRRLERKKERRQRKEATRVYWKDALKGKLQTGMEEESGVDAEVRPRRRQKRATNLSLTMTKAVEEPGEADAEVRPQRHQRRVPWLVAFLILPAVAMLILLLGFYRMYKQMSSAHP